MNVVPDTRRRAGHHLGCDDYRAKQREAHWVQGGEGTAGWLSLLACPHRAGRDPTNTHVASLAWTGRGQAQRNQDPAWILLASPDLHSAVHSPREEPAPGHGQCSHTALVTQQGLCTDHVVHAPDLEGHMGCDGPPRHDSLP